MHGTRRTYLIHSKEVGHWLLNLFQPNKPLHSFAVLLSHTSILPPSCLCPSFSPFTNAVRYPCSYLSSFFTTRIPIPADTFYEKIEKSKTGMKGALSEAHPYIHQVSIHFAASGGSYQINYTCFLICKFMKIYVNYEKS